MPLRHARSISPAPLNANGPGEWPGRRAHAHGCRRSRPLRTLCRGALGGDKWGGYGRFLFRCRFLRLFDLAIGFSLSLGHKSSPALVVRLLKSSKIYGHAGPNSCKNRETIQKLAL